MTEIARYELARLIREEVKATSCDEDSVKRIRSLASSLSAIANPAKELEWRRKLEPGDGSALAQEAAQRLKSDLDATGMLHPELGRIESFPGLLRNLSDAILPGFSAAEIVWRPGGRGFYGFRPIEQRFFSFAKSYTPRLRTTGHLYDGEEIAHGKIIFHELCDGGDPVRGGLIRPLCWLHCFSQLNMKDRLSFIERYGMPFVRATVDQATWDKEKVTLNDLISNFGPRGGGVFSRGVEVDLLQAANSNGDVYAALAQYLDDAITKVLLGQTASSGDSAGLSGGDAQSQVRDDILCADARAMEDTVNRDLFAVWMEYNYPAGTPVPKLRIETEPPEDGKAEADTALVKAQTVQTLAAAGYVIPAEEIQKVFGYTVEYHEPMQGNQMPLSGLTEPAGPEEPDAHTLNLKQKYDAMGVAIRAGLLTATPEIEEQTRAELGLPAMSPEVQKAWEATGGIRQPITLKTAESEAVNDALDVKDESVAMRAETPRTELADALEAWLGPEADARAATAELSDEELDRELRNGAPMIVNSILNADSSGFEKLDAANMRRSFDDGNQIRNRE